MWIDDEVLLRAAEPCALSLWIPDHPMVVLGSSNDPATEADVDRCNADDVPVLKRYGGGGTVVLYHGSVVISLGCWVRQAYHNQSYFRLLNQAVADALGTRWPACRAIEQRGISDLAVAGKKVAGTSLFRSRNYLLYQASLLVDLDLTLIERYLRHPSKEPDYRAGRRHADFLQGLGALAPDLTPATCLAQLESALPGSLATLLAEELIAPIQDQVPTILNRGSHARA